MWITMSIWIQANKVQVSQLNMHKHTNAHTHTHKCTNIKHKHTHSCIYIHAHTYLKYSPVHLKAEQQKTETLKYKVVINECKEVTTFAVDCYGAFCMFTNSQKFSHYIIRWAWTINKIHVIMLKASILKPGCIIDLLVESDNAGNVVLAEVTEVCLRRVKGVTILDFAFSMGPTECQEFSRHDPVEIPILHLLIVKKKNFL